MTQRRVSVLGHVQRSGSALSRHASTAQTVTVGAGLVCLIAASFVFRSGWAIAVVVVGTAGAYALVGRTTTEGDNWLQTKLASLASSADRRGGRAAWSREDGLPSAVGPVRELVLRPSVTYDDVAVSLLHHAAKREGWHQGSAVTAVLEIVGYGDGLRSVSEANLASERYGRLHSLLASPSSPVTQLDIETRIAPTDPAVTEGYYASLLSSSCPPALRSSMDELGAIAAANTETYRSFLTVRLDKGAIEERQPGRVLDLDGFVAAVGDQLGEVVRRVELSGFDVANVMNPAQVGALIRNLYVPSHPIDSPAGLRLAGDGWAYPYEVHPEYVLVRGPAVADSLTGDVAGDWYHSVAVVPDDAFPPHAVSGRWLSGLVTDVHPSPIRTIKVQKRLMTKRRARQRAIARLTTDRANMAADAKRSKVSAGVSEAAASVHQMLLDDLTHEQAAGEKDRVLIAVSGRSEAELMTARQQMTEAAEQIGIDRLRWQRNRHDVALVQMCPIAKEI